LCRFRCRSFGCAGRASITPAASPLSTLSPGKRDTRTERRRQMQGRADETPSVLPSAGPGLVRPKSLDWLVCSLAGRQLQLPACKRRLVCPSTAARFGLLIYTVLGCALVSFLCGQAAARLDALLYSHGSSGTPGNLVAKVPAPGISHDEPWRAPGRLSGDQSGGSQQKAKEGNSARVVGPIYHKQSIVEPRGRSCPLRRRVSKAAAHCGPPGAESKPCCVGLASFGLVRLW
jgi:hypothetical protein